MMQKALMNYSNSGGAIEKKKAVSALAEIRTGAVNTGI